MNELMSWRGDKSPESALTYLNDKGELMKKYKRVQGETFNYLSWMAERGTDDRSKRIYPAYLRDGKRTS